MWSDNETSTDLLGFQHLVSAVTSIVRNERLLPATIGVFGDWGSGKSSLIQMAADELKKDEAALVLTFNGWLFEGFEDAKLALMRTILDEIAVRKSLTAKAKDAIKSLLNRINWFRTVATVAKYGGAFALAGPAGLGIVATADVASQAAEALRGVDTDDAQEFIRPKDGGAARKAVREFRTDFEELLRLTDIKRLVVIIDDLDRCMPDTIIETLEAIKLFLFVKRTAFVIGADERLVKYAVRRRFPELPGERTEVGRDYLEKLIQFPIRVPQLGRAEMETYVNCLFAEIADLNKDVLERIRETATTYSSDTLNAVRFSHSTAASILQTVPEVLADRLGLAQRITPTLTAQLNGNPRQCKRFLNTLIIRMHMASSREIDLDEAALAKLMLLELFRPEAFRVLAKLQAQQNGTPAEIAILESAMKESRKRAPDNQVEIKTGATLDSAKPATKAKKPAEEMTTERRLLTETWTADSAIKEWLQIEPPLGRVNLSPYFFFARDKLGIFGEAAQRMSPIAQKILVDLTGESDIIRNTALAECRSISGADAAAIFETLADRARAEDDLGAEDSATIRLTQLVEKREDLFGQLVTFLSSLPANRIPASFVPRVRKVGATGNHGDLANTLIEKWASSENPQLARAAQEQLKPKSR